MLTRTGHHRVNWTGEGTADDTGNSYTAGDVAVNAWRVAGHDALERDPRRVHTWDRAGESRAP
jgi:hypothetical protein